MLSWNNYAGYPIGGWRLDSFLGMRGAAACYAATDDAGSAALVQIVPAADPQSLPLSRSWETAQGLADPGLLGVRGTGSAALGDIPVYFVALELPDDDVKELAARRSIGPDEAEQIVLAVASALDYLHSRDLRHGAVSPSNILFANGAAKLSVDTLALADESGRAADMQQLGATVAEMMTGERTLDAVERLPGRLRHIARGCWSGSWTAVRVVEALAGKPVETVSAPPGRPAGRRMIRVGWPVIAVAAAGLVAGIVYLRRDVGAGKQTASPPPQIIVQNAPATAAQPAPRAGADRAVRRSRANSWAVIAATYGNLDAAQHRAHKLPRKLRAHVYPPHGAASRYYVVLGSGLSSDAARKLRGRAIRMGAPRDTYVTMLSED